MLRGHDRQRTTQCGRSGNRGLTYFFHFQALPFTHKSGNKLVRVTLTATLHADKGMRHTVGTVPPSITYSVPVMALASGETRNAMRSATSLGLAGRPIGMPPSEPITVWRPPS